MNESQEQKLLISLQVMSQQRNQAMDEIVRLQTDLVAQTQRADALQKRLDELQADHGHSDVKSASVENESWAAPTRRKD